MDGSSFLHFISNRLLLAQATAMGEAMDGEKQQGLSDTAQAWLDFGTGALYIGGIFILPFVLGHFIAKAVRMPTHAFKIGVMLAAISGGLLFSWANDFQLKLGADMKGGTTLVYDIMPGDEGDQIDAGSLATALSDRINPSGTKEISIRPRGESQIEITVPMTDEFELKKIKDLLQNSGQLEFRIVANTRDHQDVIQLAREQSSNAVPQAEVLNADGDTVGRWYRVGRETDKSNGVFPLKTPVLGDIIRDSYTGKLISNPPLDLDRDFALEKWMQEQNIQEVDVLMAFEFAGEPYSVVAGDDLSSAATEFDKTGQPIVAFRLKPAGATKMLRMTAANQPDGNFHRRMAIIMDEEVLSAPQLNSPISNNGQITGRFTKEEVDFLVTILRSGRLPATLSDVPASENRVGAGLGATTISKGTNASIWAIAATFVCILIYYRFAGVVASLALMINGLLIFGVMIFIGQPLTLPGLAGLVLTVGMSVDANVLIFERIREEKAKGSAPRMSIRNGFDRAFTTIIDANLTTLIAAIVLYWIGTDQVRGFAVALIIGIATSVFTATFCSRIVFEIAEKMKFVSLSMSDGVGFLKKTFFGDRVINFMGWQSACTVFSIILIVSGIAAVFFRGKEILNIDFTGGTSVTFQLQQPLEPEELRALTRGMLTVDKKGEPVQSTLVAVEKEPKNTVYTLVTSIDDQKFLSSELSKGFAESSETGLVTYRVRVLQDAPVGSSSSFIPGENRSVRLVTYQEETAQEEATTVEPPAQENAAEEATTQETAAEVTEAAAEETSTAEATADETAGGETTGAAIELPQATPDEMTTIRLEFGGSGTDDAEDGQTAKIDGPTLRDRLIESAETVGVAVNAVRVEVAPDPAPANWLPNDVSGFSNWTVNLPVNDADAAKIVAQLQDEMQQQPLWLSLSQIGTRVAGEMQQRAVAAILISLVFIVAYIWFRFQKISYGLAAVVALVHDVLITLGVIALCHWLSGPLSFLLIDDFKIGLTEVAAFLTIIGYSLNDTIVVFDRIREVRGRNPKLDAEMVNESVNQTLSRTLLTSGTTLLTVLLLYIFGGEGIHTFAFALMVGIIVGTYSSIFIAAPVLLWISGKEQTAQQRAGISS